MRILLTGAGGQLASDLNSLFAGEDVRACSHAQLDIGDARAVAEAVSDFKPDFILNTAAFNLVDACEERAEDAFRTNTIGAYHLARTAQQAGATLVHFSTNYVFDGQKRTPYTEADAARPLSVYGMSKLGGEWAVRQYCEKHFVIRTAALYGAAGNRSKGGNFIERMVKNAREGKRLQVVGDQVVNPTFTRDLAAKVVQLLPRHSYGLYHMVNRGACSWFDFTRAALQRLGIKADLHPVSTEQLAAKARRPAYSAMENAALRSTAIPDFRSWQEALDDYLRGFSA